MDFGATAAVPAVRSSADLLKTHQADLLCEQAHLGVAAHGPEPAGAVPRHRGFAPEPGEELLWAPALNAKLH